MEDLKDLFIPFEESKEMQELGFDEPCLGSWWNNKFLLFKEHESQLSSSIGDSILAPTWDQAFNWFRKQGLENAIIRLESGYGIEIFRTLEELIRLTLDSLKDNNVESRDVLTYEEARLKCLIKLIEIYKQGIK